jgi:hypothetical protein
MQVFHSISSFIDSNVGTATIGYAEGGNLVKSLLVSNDPEYIRHFSLIFEELWENSLIL